MAAHKAGSYPTYAGQPRGGKPGTHTFAPLGPFATFGALAPFPFAALFPQQRNRQASLRNRVVEHEVTRIRAEAKLSAARNGERERSTPRQLQIEMGGER